MPILCSPVKSRLSSRLIVRLTKITFFRFLSRKRASPIRRVSRWPRSSLTQMMNRRSHAGHFRPYGDACRKCWGLERQACLRLRREEGCSSRLGVNGRRLVRNWYEVYLIGLKATTLAACRINRANPSSGRRKNGGRVGWAVGTCEESGSRRRRFRSLSGLRTGKGLRGAVCGLNRALTRSA